MSEMQSTNGSTGSETRVEGSTDALFEGGSLRSADEVAREAEEKPTSLEEWLKDADRERYQKWKKAVEQNMFPDTSDEELLNHAVQNAIEAAEEEGRNISPNVVESAPKFAITEERQERKGALMAEEDDDDEWAPLGESSGKVCDECGSQDISSYQQQTGGADEGMTGFHQCKDCGNSWRTGYGS